MQLALFIIFGLLAVAGAINFLLQRHPIHSALSLIVVMMSLAVLFWSLGAEFVLLGSLQGPDGEADTARCPGQVPSPDVVVGLSGCYYEFDGKPVGWFDDMTGWGNKDAEIRLVDGDQDTTCGGWQTDKVATALRVAGYQADVTSLAGANHFAPVFHDMRNGQWQVIADDPPGDRTVQVIVDAIAAARDARPTD